mgnify:CR=1 FL=1
MSDLATKFRENPWANIGEDIYPDGKQLYEEDPRFFVSKKDGGKLVFFASDEAERIPDEKLNVPDIKIEFDNLDNLSNQVSGLYAKLEKLDRHIDFIDKTYDGLKGPISIASKFFKR